jgi:hypothetical protein
MRDILIITTFALDALNIKHQSPTLTLPSLHFHVRPRSIGVVLVCVLGGAQQRGRLSHLSCTRTPRRAVRGAPPGEVSLHQFVAECGHINHRVTA